MSVDDILGFGEVKSKVLSFDGHIDNKTGQNQIRAAINTTVLRFDGFNEELTKIYYWHMQFPYYTGKGYKSIKVEDLHYFSESSQFGSQFRQIKGGSIRAYQENFQQVVSLIRQHLLPLLKEVKEAHFYKIWFDKISKNDLIVREELLKSSPNNEVLKFSRNERGEAIAHMKDKWVNEVEGGRMWQMNRAATEQGLDFALLPQLFFGINLDNPLYEEHHLGKSIKEQLDGDVYPIDVSLTAKDAVARNLYKFHTWLPTAIRDTHMTFKLKISALKNIYAQVQMYVEFMKPLLQEINAKSENFSNTDWYKGFESENAEVLNLIDSSFSTINVIGIGGYERGGRSIAELEFSKYGLFIGPRDIHFGKFKGKSGYVCGKIPVDKNLSSVEKDAYEKNPDYIFYPCDNRNITNREYVEIRNNYKKNPTPLSANELQRWGVMGTKFSQRRRTETINSPQGPQPQPYMRNTIEYFAASWNIYEVASYRASFKKDTLRLMETFVDELCVVREDLVKYTNYFEAMDEEFEEEFDANKKKDKTSGSSKSGSSSGGLKGAAEDVAMPLFGLGELFSVFLPGKSSGSSGSSGGHGHGHSGSGDSVKRDEAIMKNELNVVEDMWKVYSIFKKANGFIMY